MSGMDEVRTAVPIPMKDEFERAELDDRRLDAAGDRELWRDDWLELHGELIVQPTLAEAIRQEARGRQLAAQHEVIPVHDPDPWWWEV